MIQPHLWPRIEFFSSGGQEPRRLCMIQKQPFILGARPGSFRIRLCTFQMGLIIYVSLLILTPKMLSLPFDPQDNAFLSWAHSYAAFYNWSNCWVCGPLPSSSEEGFPWWTSPLQGKDFLQVCKYLQQSHVMPLLKLDNI